MPYGLDTPVLTVDAKVIHKVDTSNPANLFSMWTVFSRCADSVEQGRRLENLSWRLWQREHLNGKRPDTAPPLTNLKSYPQNIPTAVARIPDLPQLSVSVDSLADDEALDITSVSAPLEIARPRIRRQDSSTSKRDRHVSSDDFEKMIVSIVKDKTPLSAPSQPATSKAQGPAPSGQKVPLPLPAFERSGSTTTESHSSGSDDAQPSPEPRAKTTTVVRGFSPSQNARTETAPSPSHPCAPPVLADDAIPEPTSSPASKPVQSKKQPIFSLGASCSSSEQCQSLEPEKPATAPPPAATKSLFQLGGSSSEEGSASLKSAMLVPQPAPSQKQKQTSFSNNVTTRTIEPESAVDSDTEAEYVDESAIDDDEDSSDWEDSNDESGKSSVDEKYFQRVESKANLTSRRSLITLMLAQSDRARGLANEASQSTSAIPRSRATQNGPLGSSPNDSDDAPLMMKNTRQSVLKPIMETPRSAAQPIAAATNHVNAQAALSPRTTRRNMLSTELTESLRRNLLWERQQKTSTANAVLKRRHTSHDVANLKQFPERSCMKQSEDVNASSWNQYLAKDTLNGYHSKGW